MNDYWNNVSAAECEIVLVGAHLHVKVEFPNDFQQSILMSSYDWGDKSSAAL